MSEVINLNNTTPAAQTGYTLVLWQKAATSAGIDPTTGLPYYDVSAEYKAPTPFQEVPAGSINGSNSVFTLSYTPITGSLILMVNGVGQNPFGSTPDFSISGATITMTTAPAGGTNPDWLMATYSH